MTAPTSLPTLQNEPPKDTKPIGTRLGFSNYLGLLGALLGMIVLFSLLSSHFLTYDTFSTIANQIPDLVVMSIGMTFVLIIAGIDLSVGSVRDRRNYCGVAHPVVHRIARCARRGARRCVSTDELAHGLHWRRV
jgi:predicted ABC-type sugar transport system permease subunit